MNWDAIGAMGEMVGSMAVLVTLIYLSIQVRQGKDLLRSEARQVQVNNDQNNTASLACRMRVFGTYGLGVK